MVTAQPSFEDLVAQALDSLPPEIAERMENVEVVVEDEPSERALAHVAAGDTLFGLYEGYPLTGRSNYSMALPDKISIYRGPIERAFGTPEKIKEQVRRTVIHEVAHHFGIDDDRLDELGWH
jgi:predicted Zn-dependent protease with MMP-like domain